ncbi:MAG: response regulator transcription factor [Acidimicrobiia bacterium]|nr:MAG: response regulator transcription factor [Acidimicrobiia bacterium]
MRVIIADDHRIVREGLRMILSHDSEIEIVAEVEDGIDLLAVLDHIDVDVDVVLLDLRMPGLSGLETLENLRDRQDPVRVVILTMYDDPVYLRRAVELGASGYLLKSVDREELRRALHAVASGQSYIQGELTGPLIASMVEPRSAGTIEDPDSEEKRLLELLAKGLDNADLAEHLDVSEAAVKAKLRRIYRTLGVKRRSEAVAVALRLGLIS